MSRFTAFVTVILFALAIAVPAKAQNGSEKSLPEGIGITWDEIVHLLIPDCEDQVKEARAHGGVLGDGIPDARASLEDFLETNLGRRGDRFLLVRVGASWNNCDGGCFTTYLGLIDLRSKTLAWKFEDNGWMDTEALHVFRVFTAPALLCFSFQHSDGSRGGFGTTTEHWIQPKRGERGLEFDEIISFKTDSWNGGNRGGSSLHTTGRIERANGGKIYRYSSETWYGEDCGRLVEESQGVDPPDCALADSSTGDCRVVRISKVDEYRVARDRFIPAKVAATRVDCGESKIFPFNLPVRKQTRIWKRSSPGEDTHEPEIVSLNRKWVAKRIGHQYDHDDLVVEDKSGVAARTIVMESSGIFEGSIEAIGWSRDGARVFAVVKFGDDDAALLSFSVNGHDDFWEETLRGDDLKLHDGFVLEPVSEKAR